MSTGVHANFEPIEGTTTGAEQILTFNRKSRKIVITNDHATHHLHFKFNASETVGLLKGTESLSIYFTTNKIIINSDEPGIPYRIWVFG